MVIGLAIGLLIGALIAWLAVRARTQPELVRLQTELAHANSNTSAIEALTGKTLETAVTSATNRIGMLVKPIETSLERVNREVVELEKARGRDYGALTRGLTSLEQTTSSLSTALRSSNVRGQWGELQLRNTVEAAGMLKYCDFEEQTSVTTEEGRLRPDMIVRLPNGRRVVVDAKAVFHALLDADAATDPDERERHLDAYVQHIRGRIQELSRKSYWEQFSPAPDIAIMFIPSEGFYRAAIERDPSLLVHAPGQKVILASPTTLITLLRAVAVGWREADLAENAREIEKLGRELYDRLATMTGHVTELGKKLDGAVVAYNKSVASLESRVLVSARRFVEHGVGTDKQIDKLEPIATVAEPPQTIELPRADAA